MRAVKSSVEDKKQHPGVRKAVVYFDGVVKLSQELAVHHSSISKWLYMEQQIPIKHALHIANVTKGKIKAVELRPDIFKNNYIS